MAMRTTPRRTQLYSLRDFTGGLNLTTDTFRLADNESPDLLNVDLDRRGGFQVRRGITPFSSSTLSAAPDALWQFNYSGTIYTMAQVGAIVYRGTGTTWTATGTNLGSSTRDVCATTFNNVNYWVRGNADTVKWTGAVASTMGTAFNDTITATSGNIPRANHIAVHSGYLWVAGTWESGTYYPNRVRWSWANTFDNSGENWRTDDYIDIDDGKDSDEITAIIPFGDQLIVFKSNSVYAIYGYSGETFSPVNVSNTVGAVSHSASVATPAGLFFFDRELGLHVYNGKTATLVFQQIWPALRDGDIPKLQVDKVNVGWIENRLWVSVPWSDNPTPPRGVTFVFDPYLKQGGSWTKYSLELGPFCRGYRSGDNLAYVYGKNKIFKLDVNGQYFDDFGSSVETIDAWYRTRWVDLGEPAIKKRWRRAEALMQVDQGYDLPVVSYSDYDATTSVKSFRFTSLGNLNATDGVWDDPASDWDTATWAQGGIHGYVDRGSTLGIARSVSLKVGGKVLSTAAPGETQAPVFWGVDALILKYVPRRVR